MNQRPNIPFNEQTLQESPLRALRREAYDALKEYEEKGKPDTLTQAETLSWMAYSSSETDEDMYLAHMLIAKVYTFQGRFGNAQYNIEEALKLKPEDQAAKNFESQIKTAREAAQAIAKTTVTLPETFERTAQPVRLNNGTPPRERPLSHPKPPSETTALQELQPAETNQTPQHTTGDGGWSELVAGIQKMNPWTLG